jgi:hypothetical protein
MCNDIVGGLIHFVPICPRVDLPLNQRAPGDPDGGSFVPRLGRDALVKVVGGRHFKYRDGYDYRDNTS